MAIKTVQTSVAVADPQGGILASGSITFDLSQIAVVTGGGDIVPTRVTLPLDATAKIANQPVNLWANDQLSPSGTTYTVNFFNSNGLLVGSLGPVSIQGTAPIDLSQIVPASAGSAAVPFPASLGSIGWATIPSGLLIEWGVTTVSGTSNTVVTFPLAFGALYNIVVAPQFGATSTTINLTAGIGTLTQFTIYNGGATATNVCWIALGHI